MRVTRTQAVPAEFHCRHDVVRRSYLYRLAVLPRLGELSDPQYHDPVIPVKTGKIKFNRKKAEHLKHLNACVMSRLSALESNLMFDYYLKDEQTFCLDLFKETLKLMEGTHNFSNFSKTQGLFKYKTVNGEKYVKFARTEQERTRTVNSIEIVERPPPLPPSVYPLYGGNSVQFLDVVIHGQSFLHNQVRRMVGAALAVATLRVPLSQVEDLLKNPDSGWHQAISPAKSEGLYLARVDYKKEALELATEDSQELLELSKITYDPSIGQDIDDQSDTVTDNFEEKVESLY